MIFVVLDLFIVLLFSTQATSQCEEPVEEGTRLTLSCTPAAGCSDSVLAQWVVGTNVASGSTRLISNCDNTLSCTGNNNFFSMTITQENGFESSLTINRVSLTEPFNNQNNWICRSCSTVRSVCDLKIYVRPVNPKCHASEIFDVHGVLSQINLTCTADRIYPEGKCVFQVVAQNGSIVYPQQVEDSCNNLIDVAALHSGENIIQAKFGSSIQPNFDSIQPIAVVPTIRLQMPKAEIKCPSYPKKDGFYKGETVICECLLTEPGKPEGRPLWMRNGVTLPAQQNISSNFNEINSLVCAGESALGQESPGRILQVAYLRPGALNLTTDDGDKPVDICCGNPGVTVVCEKATSQVNPAPDIGLLVNGVLTSGTQPATALRDTYRREMHFRPSVGGIYNIGCRVENSIFRELKEDKMVYVTIYSPVQFKDSTMIKQEFKGSIDPNSPVNITIDITSYPQPLNFTVYKVGPDVTMKAKNYDLQYKQRAVSVGTVTLMMTLSSDSDLTTYDLILGNGIGDELQYRFTLVEDTDGVDLMPILVGCAVALVVIIAVAGVIYWRYRRRNENEDDRRRNENEDVDQTKNQINEDAEDYDDVVSTHSLPNTNYIKESEDTEYTQPDGSPPALSFPIPPESKFVKKKAKNEAKKSKINPIKALKNKRKTKEKEAMAEKSKNATTVDVGEDESTVGNQEDDTPPPRPPPREVQEGELYTNFTVLEPGAVYDTAVPSDDESDYLAIQENNGAASSSKTAEVEEDHYYSSVN